MYESLSGRFSLLTSLGHPDRIDVARQGGYPSPQPRIYVCITFQRGEAGLNPLRDGELHVAIADSGGCILPHLDLESVKGGV